MSAENRALDQAKLWTAGGIISGGRWTVRLFLVAEPFLVILPCAILSILTGTVLPMLSGALLAIALDVTWLIMWTTKRDVLEQRGFRW